MEQRHIFYTCPMHPEVRETNSGMCPQCGMNLVKAAEQKHENHETKGEHDKHEGHRTESFLSKFWVSLVLTIPVVAYSGIVKELFGYEAPVFPGSYLVSFVFGSIVFFYGGWVFLASAWRELKARVPGMMTLIALAITTAYTYSVFVTVRGEGNALYWELTTLVTIMLLGHWIEMKSVQGARGALQELSRLLPDEAELILGNSESQTQHSAFQTKKVSIQDLREGNLVLVRPGARIPADGLVLEGTSAVNESMVTGESVPVEKQAQSNVIAGTINGEGSLKIQVESVGEKTFLAGVMRLVAEAQASKSKLQLLSDKAAYYLTLIAISTGVLAFGGWLIVGSGFDIALSRLVAVLVIACPHALGLAIPLVAAISTRKAADNGFLVKQRLALEAARNITVVLFDKTGTLTTGAYGVTDIWPIGIGNEQDLLQVAASLDAQSEHPVAKAVVEKATKQGIQLLSVQEFQALPGKGVKGIIGGKELSLGGEALLEHSAFSVPEVIQREAAKGKTIIYVLEGQRVLGAIGFADIIREESKTAVGALQNMGVSVAMITGDSVKVADWVAKELGITEYFARVLPQHKAEKVRELQERGQRVAMVGDGINDAPALTQADLGIAIGAGTNVAIESAGIILVRNDPRDVAKVFKLSRMTYSKMIQNLFWATGYNIIAIPLAAGVLAFQGIVLQPAMAAVLMSLSTVIVAVNAMLLRQRVL